AQRSAGARPLRSARATRALPLLRRQPSARGPGAQAGLRALDSAPRRPRRRRDPRPPHQHPTLRASAPRVAAGGSAHARARGRRGLLGATRRRRQRKLKDTLKVLVPSEAGKRQLRIRDCTQLASPGTSLPPLVATDCTPPEGPTVTVAATFALPLVTS